ncbi:hypothetical protein PMI04_015340 [Sphingobium sp. AP49]|nr:hypothetical protein [Sphingobium sp. AP49]WHO37932.1 hypothetical protein PMI04_015340 [Sphingobium sp. AP49]
MKPIRSAHTPQARVAFTPTSKKAGQWVQTPSGFVKLDSPAAPHAQ